MQGIFDAGAVFVTAKNSLTSMELLNAKQSKHLSGPLPALSPRATFLSREDCSLA